MANPEQAGEPSMEEILASIRKIISDDDEVPEEAMNPPVEAEGSNEEDQDKAFEAAESDVFETIVETPALEEEDPFAAVLDDAAEADVFDTAEDNGVLALSEDSIVEDPQIDESMLVLGPAPEDDDIAFAEVEAPAEPEPEPEPVFEPEPVLEPEPVSEPEPMPASPHAEISAGSGLLSGEANAAVSAAFGNLANVMLSGSARTLEDLVKEMLHPMLKGWLDQNLPPLVERLVRDEIERVSRGGGG